MAKQEIDPLEVIKTWVRVTPDVSDQLRSLIDIHIYNATVAAKEATIEIVERARGKEKYLERMRPISPEKKEGAERAAFDAFKNFYSARKYTDKQGLLPLINAFLLRNEKFMELFSRISKEGSSDLAHEQLSELGEEYKVPLDTSAVTRHKRGEPILIHLLPGIVSVRMLHSKDIAECARLSSQMAPIQEEDMLKTIARFSCMDTTSSPESIVRELLGSKNRQGFYPDAGQTLLLSIDLRRPSAEILGEIKSILAIHRKRAEVRAVFGNWELYLMVHDLYRVLGRDCLCAEFLHELYSDHKTYSRLFQDEKNVQEYREQGRNLIAGEYRNYL